MTDKRYQANIITKTKVDPTSNIESGAAPGVWSLSEAEKYRKAGVWPTAGNVAIDVDELFSTYLYEGNGASQVISNGINLGQANSGGSVSFNGSTGYLNIQDSTAFDVGSSDDYTVEMFVFFLTDPNNGNVKYLYDGKVSTGSGGSTFFLAQESGNDWSTDGMVNTAFSSTDFTDGQWYHIAVTRSSGTIRTFKDGTLINSSGPNTTAHDTDQFKIGARYTDNFILSEAIISNFRFVNGTALYTSNFTVPTAELTAVTNTALLTCQGDSPLTDNSTNANTVNAEGGALASGAGPFTAATAGEGGLVWTKGRSAADGNRLFDTERGATKTLITNSSLAEATLSDGLTDFNSSGFSISTSTAMNTSSSLYTSWTFRQQSRFFAVQTYTGTGPGSGVNEQQVSHNLGVKPGLIIIKRTSDTGDWWVFTDVIDGSNDYAYLNQTGAFNNSGNNVPTDSVFNVGGVLNVSGDSYVAYLFANNDGDGGFGPSADQDIIKCGTYSGTGALQEIDLGFEAQWVMIKRTDATQDWMIFDQMRGLVANPVTGSTPTNDQDARLRPNSSAAESVDTFGIDPSPNGFAVRGNNVSVNGSTYFYVAIRRGPLSVPTSGTEVFEPTSYTGNGTANEIYTGFPVDLEIVGPRTEVRSWKFGTNTRTIGRRRYVATASSAVEATDGPNVSGGMFGSNVSTLRNGTEMNASADSPLISWKWRRAPKYFDIVTHDGTGGAITLNHNLTIAPEMIWTKSRTNTENWQVWHKDVTGNLELDNSSAANTGSIRVDTVTATSFRYTGFNTSNGSGQTYVSYIFGTAPGVSKVGSFSHTNGTAQDIDCGFTSGARFVLLKRYDSTGSWVVFDTARGIIVGNDPYVKLDVTDAEVTGDDVLVPYSAGFTIASGFLATGNFLFYAIA